MTLAQHVPHRSRHRSDWLADRYRLTSKLGSGATCEVWRAADRYRDADVAIKLLKSEFDYEEWQRRLLREGATLGLLNHPKIVHLLEVDQERPFLVLELLPGKTWREIDLHRDIHGVARIVIQVCSGLEALHRAGFVHRDVKPGNIMIHEGNATIIGLSITRASGQRYGTTDPTMTYGVMGAADYFSPEQATGKAVGPASDIFSLGTVIFQQLTGQHPFPIDPRRPLATIQAIAEDDPKRLGSFGKELCSLESMIDAMLAKDPASRPSLEDVQVACLRVLSD